METTTLLPRIAPRAWKRGHFECFGHGQSQLTVCEDQNSLFLVLCVAVQDRGCIRSAADD
jgi:hypothetical protein